jgi:hypothetical protein
MSLANYGSRAMFTYQPPHLLRRFRVSLLDPIWRNEHLAPAPTLDDCFIEPVTLQIGMIEYNDLKTWRQFFCSVREHFEQLQHGSLIFVG